MATSTFTKAVLANSTTIDFDAPAKKPIALGVGPRLLVVASEPKAGKTAIFGSLPDSLTLDLEGGSDFYTNKSLPFAPHEWARFYGAIYQIKARNEAFKAGTAPTPACTFLIIDSLTRFNEMLWHIGTFLYKNTIQGKNFSGETVEDLGKNGFQWPRVGLNQFLNDLETAAPHIILLGHLKDKYLGKEHIHGADSLPSAGVDEKGAVVASIKTLNMTGQLALITVSRADAFAKLTVVGKGAASKRYLSFVYDADTPETQTRVAHLANNKFLVSELVDWRPPGSPALDLSKYVSKALRCYPHKIYPSCFPDLFTIDEDGDFKMDTSKITGNIFPTA